MLGMLSGLFKKENSKDEAKNRLKLVLISKYVEIEKSKLNIEVSPCDDDPRKIALVANIPIIKAGNRK